MDHIQQIVARAHEHPDKHAIVLGESVTTYGALLAEADIRARELRRRGLGVGSRIAVMLPTGRALVTSYLAIGLVGATYVPINPASSPSEVEHYVARAEVTLVISDVALASAVGTAFDGVEVVVDWVTEVGGPGELEVDLANGTRRELSDEAVVIFTSGTSSKPKAVRQSYASHLTYHQLLETVIGLRPSDRVMCPLPLYAGFGLKICSGTLFSGATLHLLDHFNPVTCLEAIESGRTTVLFGVPTMVSMMMQVLDQREFDTSSLEVAYLSGSAIPAAMSADFTAMTGCKTLALYGQSECPMSAIEPRFADHKDGAAGKISPGFRYEVLDDAGNPVDYGTWGELAVTGPTLMLGYDRDPEGTAAAVRDGWLHTGDLAMLDPDGYVYVKGRAADVIIRGGMNISPLEIEDAITSHDGVLEAAVVGVPDDLFGQRVHAFVVAAPGVQAGTLQDELEKLCRERLAEYKVPERFTLLDVLPKNHNGKVIKRMLVQNEGVGA